MLSTDTIKSSEHVIETHPLDPFRKLYQDYFDKAELKRRWNVKEAIPWDEVKYKGVDTELVDILEAFYATEMFLPDYTAKLMKLNRQNMGMAWFVTNWGYEESKHAMSIEEWFIRSGRRTPQEMERFNESLLASEWDLPFETSRQMLCYTLFQELATQLNYINLSKFTAPAGDKALQRILLLIAGDEGNHHKMFVDCVNEHMRLDREGTMKDIAMVLSNFSMPAHSQIPGWEERGKLIESKGIYNAKVFIKRVMIPGLERLDLDTKIMRPYMAAYRQQKAGN